ncbi:hypothetical protein D3C87_2093190 [compost metagenome]
MRHDAGEHGYTVRLEHIARLIFKQVHGLVSFYVEVVFCSAGNRDDRDSQLRKVRGNNRD